MSKRERFTVQGTITDKNEKVVSGLLVQAFDDDPTTPRDLLGSDSTTSKGRYKIMYSPTDFKKPKETGAADLILKIFSPQGEFLHETERYPDSGKKVNINVNLKEYSGEPTSEKKIYTVQGKVRTPKGIPLKGKIVKAFDKKLTTSHLLGNATIDEKGEYKIRFSSDILAGRTKPDIELRIYDKNKEIALSSLKYNATPDETIDISVNKNAIPEKSEYDQLIAELQEHTDGLSLGDMQEEGNTMEKLNYLTNKTGWDPRILGMLAQTVALSASTGIDPAHYYAMLRAGIPANTNAIAKLSLDDFDGIMKAARKKNIITTSSDTIKETKSKLQRIDDNMVLNAPAVGVSSLGDVLSLRLNNNEKKVFVKSYRESGNNAGNLWKKLEANGISKEKVALLKLDGKLGYITGNNAPLMERITTDFTINTLEDMVHSGFYKVSAWESYIADDLPEQLSAEEYASSMAMHLQLSYPTLIVAAMINNQDINVTDPRNEVQNFFVGNHEKFAIGTEPVKKWDNFETLSDEAKEEIKIIERQYQMSPSNESMIALSKLKFNSTHEITHFTEEEFIVKFSDEFPNLKEIKLVHNKATEIQATVLNISTAYVTNMLNPHIYSLDGESEKTNLEIAASPSLEELFNNLDYCSCEHCKSVLSPASYLVDMLQFINLSDIPHELENPIDVLLKRRPDLEHILLSCENTNTVLPYIDLVNEILEHYIVNDHLDDFVSFNVEEGTKTEDLLANPQFIDEAAYTEVSTKVYPPSLPFDQPLEALRLLFNAFDLRLFDLFKKFNTPAQTQMEVLGLSPIEFSILTDTTVHDLPEYFGEASGTLIGPLNSAVANGKTFSKRMDIEYTDLVALLKTNFINPGNVIVPQLKKLPLSLLEIQSFLDGTINATQLNALLPPDFDPVPLNNDVPAWLQENQSHIMGLITLTEIGTELSPCNFAEVELRFAFPDNSSNQLDELAYYKMYRFIRLWKKLGWSINQLDKVIGLFLPVASVDITMAKLDDTFRVLVIRISNLLQLMDQQSVSKKKINSLFALWDTSKDDSFRIEQLAKLIKMSSSETQALIALSGLDPLNMDMENDEPSLIRFIRIASELKAASVKVKDLNYILRHKDEAGELASTDATLLSFLQTIRNDLATVDAEFQVAPDNADFILVAEKMKMVYDPSVSDLFMELFLGVKTYHTAFIMQEETLPEKLTDASPDITYDAFKKELLFSGLMSGAAQTALDLAADSLTLADMEVIDQQPVLDAFISSFKTAVQTLKDTGQDELTDFGAEYPELKLVYDTVSVIAQPAAKASALLAAILPELILKRKILILQQSLTAIVKNEPDVLTALTEDPEVLKGIDDPAKVITDDFLLLEESVDIDTNDTYEFYLNPFGTDDYQVYLQGPENTTVTLTINGDNVINAVVLDASGEAQNTLPVSLEVGNPAEIQLVISGLPAGEKVKLLWRTKGVAKEEVNKKAILLKDKVDNAKTALLKLFKASQLQKIFDLTTSELSFLASTHTETKDVLNELDTDGSITAAALNVLWEKVHTLIRFTLFKKEMEDEENTWIQILEDPEVKTPQGDSLLLGTTAWKQTDLDAVLLHFGHTIADLANFKILQQLTEAMNCIDQIGFDAADIISWATNTPTVPQINSVKDTIEKSLSEVAWRDMIQSVNDVLRNKQRDALVSYILYHQRPEPKIDTANKLYEFFLIDVQMDSCMQTSRIKQALSSVQLFINRCLMNLELKVAPSSIREHQWEWMKRYRVWEANRKVFLYPENWLEPEFRDNKSPFFKELEGELLQADINTDLAEKAFLNYLKKLDDVARLEITATYLQENEQGNQDDDILHVFGRTNGKTRQYYHRRFEYGYWTPWEKVGVNIEADHIFPVVWKSQLFLFWLTTVETPKEVNKTLKPQVMGGDRWGNHAKKNVEITMSWAEFYKGKWTSPKSSEPSDPVRINNLDHFNPNYILLYGRIEEQSEGFNEWLTFDIIYIEDPVNLQGFGGISKITYTSKNAPPFVENGKSSWDFDLMDQVKDLPIFNYGLYRVPYLSNGKLNKALLRANSLLTLDREFKVSVVQPPKAKNSLEERTILTKKNHLFKFFKTLPARYPTSNQWEAPLFYSDERSVFFIQPDERVISARDFIGIYDIGNLGTITDWNANIIPLEEIPVEIPPVGREIDPLINPVDPLVINKNLSKVLKTNKRYGFEGTILNGTETLDSNI